MTCAFNVKVQTGNVIVVVGSSWDNQQALLSSVNVPWLLLRTVPALGDGNLLKTLCSQHGPLQNFFVNANNGQALVRYNTKEESSKAQKNLNSCSFGETTIMAEFVDESEVRFSVHFIPRNLC